MVCYPLVSSNMAGKSPNCMEVSGWENHWFLWSTFQHAMFDDTKFHTILYTIWNYHYTLLYTILNYDYTQLYTNIDYYTLLICHIAMFDDTGRYVHTWISFPQRLTALKLSCLSKDSKGEEGPRASCVTSTPPWFGSIQMATRKTQWDLSTKWHGYTYYNIYIYVIMYIYNIYI